MSSTFKDTLSKLDSIQPETFDNDAERYAAKEAARRLLARLETPFERSWALSFENPVLISGVQICSDLGIWTKWTEVNKQNGGAAQTLDDILGMCNVTVNRNLLRRFLKHISALYLLEETGIDMWKPTPFSLAMGDSATYIGQTMLCGIHHTIPGGIRLAKFLKKIKYEEPLDKTKFDNYADLVGEDFFDHCQNDPIAGGSFIGLMTALQNYKMDWTDVFDTRKLVEGTDLRSGPLFVDVGGAHGLDTARLLARHEDLPSDVLIVQDLPEVVSTHAKEQLDGRIKRMAHDFFTAQPVVGSRAYFFHAVPHDWPDADCLRIFGHVKAAMKKGYSKLLIYEVVLPAQGATNLMTTLDLQLMSTVSGLERTEEHWTTLLGQAGFKIISVLRHPRAVESVIEAELV
ncbi:S-adenosyl-L-methionine-dependent methyltransferase [Pseudomassariella vexata]|uniref:S-adenosyl-L-methionine-dependent methyltransferase n=1 Tax=Pseudomassariella vexata TaxID=1141098 RepID=A0A1Y2E8M7_9PEZI|nr:S-adenosyl-L-methionine-dependent methyltransferase [Pseudomassariella vexata]ORY67787.1 S-adenosyl-L-methionine-dependent methyltransferase [Pseudomassariella vexata]